MLHELHGQPSSGKLWIEAIPACSQRVRADDSRPTIISRVAAAYLEDTISLQCGRTWERLDHDWLLVVRNEAGLSVTPLPFVSNDMLTSREHALDETVAPWVEVYEIVMLVASTVGEE